MSKIIMHIDLNAFFASAAAIKEPELKGKPLIIAGNSRRGIVSTASYEARKYGIHSAMPTYMAKKLCPHVIIREGDFKLYKDLSNKFFNIIREYTPIIEIASIDECFADLTLPMKGIKDPHAYLKKIQDELYQKTGLGCSIGLAPTKFLAKMGSDYKKPMGITIIRRRDVPKILWPIKIKDMYGVGKKTAPKLEQLGIYTIGDLAKTEAYEVKKLLGKSFYGLQLWANGYGSDHVETEDSDPKSISSSETLQYDTDDLNELREHLHARVEEVAYRANKNEVYGTTVSIQLKDSEFKSITRSVTFSKPINSLEDIYAYAVTLLENNYRNQLIRLIGVSLSSLNRKENFFVQLSLFNYQKEVEKNATKLLIKDLNRTANKELFKPLSALKKKEKKHDHQ